MRRPAFFIFFNLFSLGVYKDRWWWS